VGGLDSVFTNVSTGKSSSIPHSDGAHREPGVGRNRGLSVASLGLESMPGLAVGRENGVRTASFGVDLNDGVMTNRAKLAAAATVVMIVGPVARGQARAPDTFEVASVKPIGQVGGGFAGGMNGCDGSFPKVAGNRFVVTTTPFALITWAYGYNKVWGCAFTSSGDLITGGPSWVRSERFEVQALMPEGSPTYTLDEFMKGDAPGLEKMLQTLLADRFQLLVRHVIKEVPGYALAPGKGGPKLKTSAAEDQPTMGVRRQADPSGQIANKMVGRKMEMRDLAFLLVMITHRPVIDRTGLTGHFNFDLDFAPFDSDATADSSAPSLFTAIQEQLGLRLDTTKAPLDGLVIERAARPSGN
jgi:uncharacterized protein (TIGR03435 family)